MGWLWPESNLKKARWSLNSAIHTLRKVLNGCLSSPSAAGYVVLEEGYYKLSPTLRLSTDVDDFDERYESGHRDGRNETCCAIVETPGPREPG